MKSNDLISRAGVLRMLDENGVVFRNSIEKMPVVDAVPVEWLRERMNMADDVGDLDSVDMFSWIL